MTLTFVINEIYRSLTFNTAAMSIHFKVLTLNKVFLFFTLLIATFGFCQSDIDSIAKFSKSTEITKFYTNKKLTFEATNQLYQSNAEKIKNDLDIYYLHHLSWALYNKQNSKKNDAIRILEELNSIEKQHVKKESISSNYTLYGIILYELNEPVTARKYFKKALNVNSEAKDSIGEKGNLINIGNTYFIENNYDSALYWFIEAGKFQSISEFEKNRLNNIATIYMNTQRNEDAISIYHNLLNDSSNSKSNLTSTHYNLAIIYKNSQQIDSAIFHLSAILDLHPKWSDHVRPSQVHQFLAECYEAQSNYKKAYLYLHQSDSLKRIENFPEQANIIDEIKTQYEKSLLEKEVEYNQKEVQILKSKKRVLLIFLSLTTALSILIAFLFIIKQKQNRVLLKQNIELAKQGTPKKPKPTENEKVDAELIEKLEEYLIVKEGFKENNLSLEKVSKKLKSNRTYVSKAINSHYECGFNELLNQIRIQEARKLLIDPKFEHFSIEGISQTVGYNSISSFNSYFKKETGLTPSYFRKNS